MTLDEKIDIVLKSFGDLRAHDFWNTCDIALNEDSTEHDIEHEIVRQEMIRQDLISSENDRIFLITAKGLRIFQTGGWLKYCEYKITNANAAKITTENETKLQRRVIRDNRIFGYGGMIIALTGVFVAWWTTSLTQKTTELEQQIKTITKQKDSLYQMTGDQKNLLETKDKEIQGLKQKPDSTKK